MSAALLEHPGWALREDGVVLSKVPTIVGILTGLGTIAGWIVSPQLRNLLRSLGPYSSAALLAIGIIGCLGWLAAVGFLVRGSLRQEAETHGGQAGVEELRTAVLGQSTPIDDQAFAGFFISLFIFVAISVCAMGVHLPFVGYLAYLSWVYASLGIAIATPPVARHSKRRFDRSRKRRQRKFCVDCAELIPRAARVCPHCGYRFDFSEDVEDGTVWL